MTRLRFGIDFTAYVSVGGFQCHTGKNDDNTQWVVYENVVVITLKDGREFFLPNGYVVWVHPEDDAPYQTVKNAYFTDIMLDKVKEHGVDLSHWNEIEKTSLEEIFDMELAREEERLG